MKALLREGFVPIYLDRENERWKSYVCKKNDMLCRVLVINDLTYASEIVAFTAKQECTDYISQFYRQGRYYIVYAYFKGQSLAEKLNQIVPPSQAERSEIARNIMKEFIKKRVDFELAEYALNEQNIDVCPDGRISFIYPAPTFKTSVLSLYALFGGVIERVLGKGLTKEANSWLERLKKSQFDSMCEAYLLMPKKLFFEAEETKERDDGNKVNEKEKKAQNMELIGIDDYWDCRWFYLKKRPVILAFTLAAAAFTIIMTVIVPYLTAS